MENIAMKPVWPRVDLIEWYDFHLLHIQANSSRKPPTVLPPPRNTESKDSVDQFLHTADTGQDTDEKPTDHA